MIVKHVIAIRGENMHGFIRGKSTRNTRIERFWQEYYTNVIKSFYDEFTNLEQLGYLNRIDNNDSWVLHKVYFFVISKKLMELKIYYINYPIRTAKVNLLINYMLLVLCIDR